MSYLLAEIWLCLIVATLLGVAAGWLLWGRQIERLQRGYRRRLGRLRGNWETVEEQLARALARVSELEGLLRDRPAGPVSEGAIDPPVASVPIAKDDVWGDEARLLETTVRGLEERIRSLEASQELSPDTLELPLPEEHLVPDTGLEPPLRRGASTFSHTGLPLENAHSLRRRVVKRKETSPVK
jgi:hypothetical protein